MSMNPVTVQALRERLAQEEAAHASAIARRVEILGDLAQQNAIISAHEANIEAYRSDIPDETPPSTETGDEAVLT